MAAEFTMSRLSLPYGIEYHHGVLNRELCGRLISYFEAQPKPAIDHLINGAPPAFTHIELDEHVGETNPLMRIALRRVRRGIDRYLDDQIAEPALREQMKSGCYGLELRIKRYDVGSYFPLHTDDASLLAQTRRIAYILYLNDDFGGGETVFHNGRGETCAIQPVAGAMLVFPVHPVYMHEGRPITRGSKYILNGFARILLSQARATTPDGTPVSKAEAVRWEIGNLTAHLLEAAGKVFG